MKLPRRNLLLAAMAAAALVLCASMASAVPLTIHVQGLVESTTPPSAGPVNGALLTRFSLYRGGDPVAGSGGTLLYQETSTITFVQGVFSYELGTGVAAATCGSESPCRLTEDDFATDEPIYLGLEILGERLLPWLHVNSVPFAIRSARVTAIDGARGGIVRGSVGLTGGSFRSTLIQSTDPSLNGPNGDALAGGSGARAVHAGSFVWSDGSFCSQCSATCGACIGSGCDEFANVTMPSFAPGSFGVKATGGVIFATGQRDCGGVSPDHIDDLLIGTRLFKNSGIWSALCDSAAKTNLRPVDGQDVLSRLDAMPVVRWSYKAQSVGAETVDHIGPTAQVFYRAFGLGDDRRYISTTDPAGVALAAIKELHKENLELRDQVAELKQTVDTLLRARGGK